MNDLVYLASPYSHADVVVRQGRFEAVCEVASILMMGGTVVFSPIAHTHPIAKYGGLDALDADFWLKFDQKFIDAAGVLWVLTLDGWKDSHGVTWEINYADNQGKPVGYIDPVTLEITRGAP